MKNYLIVAFVFCQSISFSQKVDNLILDFEITSCGDVKQSDKYQHYLMYESGLLVIRTNHSSPCKDTAAMDLIDSIQLKKNEIIRKSYRYYNEYKLDREEILKNNFDLISSISYDYYGGKLGATMKFKRIYDKKGFLEKTIYDSIGLDESIHDTTLFQNFKDSVISIGSKGNLTVEYKDSIGFNKSKDWLKKKYNSKNLNYMCFEKTARATLTKDYFIYSDSWSDKENKYEHTKYRMFSFDKNGFIISTEEILDKREYYKLRDRKITINLCEKKKLNSEILKLISMEANDSGAYSKWIENNYYPIEFK